MKSTACFVLKLIKASVYVIKKIEETLFWNTVILCGGVLHVCTGHLHLEIHYPVTHSLSRLYLRSAISNINYGD